MWIDPRICGCGGVFGWVAPKLDALILGMLDLLCFISSRSVMHPVVHAVQGFLTGRCVSLSHSVEQSRSFHGWQAGTVWPIGV